MNDKLLPPMPKLRPRPDLPAMPPPPLKKRKVSQEPQEIVVVDQDSKTSRLLTKSECGRGGGGRKKTTGSLIHSIPKFTQVAPKDGQISEVQKVLQSRLLSKQLSRQSCSTTTPLVERKDHHKSKAEATAKAEFPASSMLQSIVSLHERVSQGKIFTPKPLPIINSSSRKRVRKPDKSSICHVLKQSQDEPEVIIHEEPEVTITPTTLKPEEYRQLGMPKGFIFWPMANVFVHPSVLKQLSNEQKQPTNSSQVSICKFKFTGGAKPSLEEKKMMSVDSDGHFRYYSGDNSDLPRAVETLSREVMAANASHIVTDRFTSLTADKLGRFSKDLK